MLNALVPVIMMILGVLIMALSSNPNAKEVGKGLFWAGSFALAFYWAGHPVRIGAL